MITYYFTILTTNHDIYCDYYYLDQLQMILHDYFYYYHC